MAGDFPFYFVQLPCWLAAQTEPVEEDAAWAVSREMMRLVARSVPNTGVAVSIDTGDDILLHPKDKKPIGLRLAYLALKKTHGKDFVDYGPFYKSHRVEGDKIVLTFDYVGSGLMTGDHPSREARISLPPAFRSSLAICSANRIAWSEGPVTRRLMKFPPCGSEMNARISISSPVILA